MGALDTLSVTGILNAANTSILNLRTLLPGAAGLQSVTGVSVVPLTTPLGFIGLFSQDAAPRDGDAMPRATYPVAYGSGFIPFDPNAICPDKTNGNLWVAWSTNETTLASTIGTTNRALSLSFNTIVQGASFFAPRPYYAPTGSFAAAANATDVSTIAGAAGRIINIRRVIVSSDTALTAAIIIGARSAANTGGTSIALTPMPGDRIQAASLASVLKYTANPGVLGALYGVADVRFGCQPSFPAAFNFAQGELVLRAATDLAVVNMSAVAAPGNLAIQWFFTEEFANP